MKSKFLKMAMVAASAIALMNCGEATEAVTNAANAANVEQLPQTTDPAVDPATGLPVTDPAVDPATGLPVTDPAVDPATGLPVTDPAVDPATGLPVTDPAVDPATGLPVTEPAVDPANPSNPANPAVDPVVDPATDPVAAESSSSVATDVPASSSSVKEEKSSSSVKAEVSSSSVKEEVSSSSVEAPKGIFLTTDTDENKEYMEVEYIEHTGPDGGAILSYPKRLSDTQKHGIVIWGPGGGTEPGAYGGMIHRLASHGFVVIALSSSPGDASKAIPALNWLEEKSKDASGPLYNKLDFTKVGASGHSMGGLESEEVLIKDSRVITAVMNNSGNLGGGAAQYVPAGKSIALVYGEVGSEAPNAERDYATNVKVPACLIKMEGNNFGHGSGPWDGIGATVSWMRWQLGGEDFRKADFVGTSGKYINGSVPGTPGHYNGQCKNF